MLLRLQASPFFERWIAMALGCFCQNMTAPQVWTGCSRPFPNSLDAHFSGTTRVPSGGYGQMKPPRTIWKIRLWLGAGSRGGDGKHFSGCLKCFCQYPVFPALERYGDHKIGGAEAKGGRGQTGYVDGGGYCGCVSAYKRKDRRTLRSAIRFFGAERSPSG